MHSLQLRHRLTNALRRTFGDRSAGRARHRLVLLAGGVVVVAAGAWLLVDPGSDEAASARDDAGSSQAALESFCDRAEVEAGDLAGSAEARSDAAGRLAEVAPAHVTDVLLVVSAGSAAPPEGLFVDPGDPMSEVNLEVAAEVWADRASAVQAWTRVERMLIDECGVHLREGTG